MHTMRCGETGQCSIFGLEDGCMVSKVCAATCWYNVRMVIVGAKVRRFPKIELQRLPSCLGT